MKEMKYILNKNGKPKVEPNLLKWGKWFEKAGETRCIGLDRGVSTVFLGIDHQFGDGPPLLWETLCPDDYIERYSSEEDARAGHARLVIERGKSKRKVK
jgi:hypothetical protein